MTGFRSMPVLGVKDVSRSIAYYRDKLGFEVAGEWGPEAGPLEFAIVSFGDITLALDLDEAVLPRSHGWAAYLYVDDVDRLQRALTERGVEIVRPPANAFYGCRDMDVRDLDGHLLAFGQDLNPGERGPGL
ncbi:MAG: glyoxalase superfamily protein [Pseudomonadota bacterium]